MQVLDIRIERNYQIEELYDEEGIFVTVAEPYWELYINSEYYGSSVLDDPMFEFAGIISRFFSKTVNSEFIGIE